MLSNFQLGSHPLLQTLLLGQPEFRETLLESNQLEQLRQRVIATHHLGAMQSREVQPYIEHRLNCVGWTGNPGFEPEVFAQIHDATGGIPRRINQIVNRLLLLGAVDQRDHIDGSMLTQVLDEMSDDGALAVVTPPPVAEPEAAAEAAPANAFAHSPAIAPAPVDAINAAEAISLIEAALADRDAQLVELQSAVVELAAAAEARDEAAAAEAARIEDDSASEAIATLQAELTHAAARTEKLEARLDEQARTLRHTLTMLIEWIESGDGQRNVA